MEYGCIGEHLTHSFSKEIHNALADYDYCIQELTPEQLPQFMKTRDFKAINVTIPYKKDVIPFLEWISPEAKAINAVNTIVNVDGKLYGYNTDFYGLKSLIERQNVSLKENFVAILGSGGTSNTAFAVAKSMGASDIVKVSRAPDKGYISYDELYEIADKVNVIINTTPCGMYPNIGKSAVDVARFKNLFAVIDAVYNPLVSKLVYDARRRGITATGGLYMLVSQAAYAVEKFIDAPVDNNKVEKIYSDLYKSKMNIVLVGMPSCGKSTIGKKLAERLNKYFVDTDEYIVSCDGREIPRIFQEDGEEIFRQKECDAVIEIAKNNSAIVATGGGVVLNESNIDILKENGRVYFIDRPLDLLVSTGDRPLSSNRSDLEKRYNERYSLYTTCADAIIDGTGTVDEVAQRIEADYYGYTCN